MFNPAKFCWRACAAAPFVVLPFVAWAEDGFWDQNNLAAAEQAAADLYEEVKYIPTKPKPITKACGNCFDPTDIASSFPPGSAEHFMLSFIGRFEAPAGYDDFFRGARPRPPKPLTTMTVSEVRAWQRKAGYRGNYPPGAIVSSASGRFQIISKTMDHLIAKLELDGSEMFDKPLQDRMAMTLLHEAGWLEFRAGTLSPKAFGTNVARVWAAFPALTGKGAGRSVYHNYNGNKALVSSKEFLAHLTELKEWFVTREAALSAEEGAIVSRASVQLIR